MRPRLAARLGRSEIVAESRRTSWTTSLKAVSAKPRWRKSDATACAHTKAAMPAIHSFERSDIFIQLRFLSTTPVRESYSSNLKRRYNAFDRRFNLFWRLFLVGVQEVSLALWPHCK